MSYSLSFYLDRATDDPKSTEYKSIYYYITWSGNRLRKSSGLKCRQCDWIESGEKVNPKIEYSLKVNPVLSDIKYRVEKFFDKSTDPTKEDVYSVASGKAKVGDLNFIELFDEFVTLSENGKRKTKKGKVVKEDRVAIYKYTQELLKDFQSKKKYNFSWSNINNEFYGKFTAWLWDDKGFYDNSVGTVINVIKTYLNWAVDQKKIPHKYYDSTWITWIEEIDIFVFYPDELKLLFSMEAKGKIVETKDTFLAGCMTCLRVKNLLSLERDMYSGGKLKVYTTKTGKAMTLEVPPALDKIFNKYPNLLPPNNKRQFNKDLKKLGSWFKEEILKLTLNKDFIGNSWTNNFIRTRHRRGEPTQIPIDMGDIISSHTMRRTGITTLLIMGLSETEVKAISGHDISSRSFAKYVKIAEQYLSKKSNEAWSKISE
jgi:integrase